MKFLLLVIDLVYNMHTSFDLMTEENKVRSLTSLTSSQLGLRFSLVSKDPLKQLQDVPVPQAELREPAISVRAAIIANIQLLKIDFLE